MSWEVTGILLRDDPADMNLSDDSVGLMGEVVASRNSLPGHAAVWLLKAINASSHPADIVHDDSRSLV